MDFEPHIKSYLNQSVRNRVFYDSSRINSSFSLPKKLLSQLQSAPKPKLDKLRGTYDKSVISDFLKHFTFNSSRLEGLDLTLASTIKIMESNDLSDETKIIVHNHKKAVTWLVSSVKESEFRFVKDLKRGADPIKDLHCLLMEGLIKNDGEGEIRTSGVIIGESYYTPLADKEELELYLNQIAIKSFEYTNPHERALFLLIHISYLQAFWDGNKRTGRLMSNVPLLEEGLIPCSFSEVNEDNYLEAIIYYYETGDYRPLAFIWGESYINGIKHFDVIERSFKSANIAKIEMAELRANAVIKIVTENVPADLVETIAKKIWENSQLKKKYDFSLFLASVISSCNKLSETFVGMRVYNLTETQIEEFSKNWKR